MIRVALIGFGLAGRVFHAPLISSVEEGISTSANPPGADALMASATEFA